MKTAWVYDFWLKLPYDFCLAIKMLLFPGINKISYVPNWAIDLKNAKRPSKRAKFKKKSHWRRGKKK